MAREEQGKRKVKADPHQVMAWVDHALGRVAFQIPLGLLLLLALTILLSPRLWRSERVVTTLKVGMLADATIKATHTFDYFPPQEKLENLRREAEKRVLPVFDHQETMGATLARRIKQAFEVLAPNDAGVAVDAGEAAAPAGKAAAAKPGAGPAGEPEAKDPAAPVPNTEEELENKRTVFSRVIGTRVMADDFKLLLSAPSPRELRGILLGLVVEEAMSNLIASRRAYIKNMGREEIVVRHMRGERLGAGGEEKLTNLGRIKGLNRVAQEVQTKADVRAAKLSAPLAQVVVRLAQSLIQPNLAFNSTETNRRVEVARQKVAAKPITYVKGQVIVRDGDPIDADHIHILETMEPKEKSLARVQIPFGVGIFVLLLILVQYRYARREFSRFYMRPRDLLAMGVLLVGLVALAKSVVALGGGYSRGAVVPIFIFAIPLASGAMLVRMLISAEAAAVFATVLSLVSGLVVDQSWAVMLFYFITSLVASGGVSRVQSRSTILRAGLWAGLVGAGLVLGFRMSREGLWAIETLWGVLAAVGGGLLTSFVTLALLPAKEWLFAYTTDVTLLELANLNHPLLRDLILRAPGTYHHSMIVGSLSETACENIGANGLLARVASYYHDIGKSKNSEYFAENFRSGDNPHNRLKPSMSALIIRNHVKDTIEMLREHGVPELVIETATQHHGKTLIEFFFHKAREKEDVDDEVLEEDYRYPGPKPQSREAGVIMLADGVEAAARSLPDPTEDRLQGVVQRMINSKFSDGQLDHCDLTLRDLHNIARSFLQVLRGIYHQRPSYPWQKKGGDGAAKGDTGKMKVAGGEEDEEKAEGKEEGEGKARGEKKGEGKGKGKGQGKKRGRRKGKGEREEKQEAKVDPDETTPLKDTREAAAAPEAPEAGGEDVDEDKPAGEGEGEESAEQEDAKEDEAEGNPDLKRLGLN